MNVAKRADQYGRLACVLLLALLGVELAMGLLPGSQLSRAWMHDAETYMTATRRWLDTGAFYTPFQLAGPYPVVEREILYPPVALLLFVPLTFLPVLWFAPVLIVGWIVWTHRPGPWRLAGVLALLVLPLHYSTSYTLEAIANGSPICWVAAFIALATRWPVFGPFALFRPAPVTLPFALVGIRSRAWWGGLALFAGLSALFAPMWLDYVRVVLNARTDGPSFLYGLGYVPMLLMPLVSSAGSRARSVTVPSLLGRFGRGWARLAPGR